jgi:hemerythrin superfamily protein
VATLEERTDVSTQDKDVVELLLEQHEHIRSLFAAVQSAKGATKQEKFEELRRFLAVHETAEELVTHPNARTADGGNDVVDARLEEETESKKILAELDGTSVEDPAFRREVRRAQDGRAGAREGGGATRVSAAAREQRPADP